MEPNIPPLAPGETILHEIKTSPRTITYYSILASPLMGVWFIGLLIFLLHTYRTNAGNWKIFLFQAIVIAGLALLVGAVMRWLWRVDVLQRDAWLTDKGLWMKTPTRVFFIPYLAMVGVKATQDWASSRMGIGKITLTYREGEMYQKVTLIGVEHDGDVAQELQSRIQP